MATMRKFLFEADFDSAKKKKQKKARELARPVEVAEAPPPPPPPPTVLESEALRMEAEAYQRGLAEGEAKGRAAGEEKGRMEATNAYNESVERQTAQALQQIAAQVTQLAHKHRDAMKVSQEEALRVAHAAIMALHPVYGPRHGADEVAAVVIDTLNRLRDEPQATVRVSGATADRLQESLDPVLDRLGFQGELILQADDSMADGDVVVDWRGGSAQRSSRAIADAVLCAIEAAIPPNAADEGAAAEAES